MYYYYIYYAFFKKNIHKPKIGLIHYYITLTSYNYVVIISGVVVKEVLSIRQKIENIKM